MQTMTCFLPTLSFASWLLLSPLTASCRPAQGLARVTRISANVIQPTHACWADGCGCAAVACFLTQCGLPLAGQHEYEALLPEERVEVAVLLCSLANGTAYLRNHFDELEEDRKTNRKELMALKAKMKKCALYPLSRIEALSAA